MKIYTGGTFDCFHYGHASFLERCAKLGNPLFFNTVTVALNTDEFIEKFKGHKPIMSYKEREEVLKSCKWVDSVIKNVGSPDSKKTIIAMEEKPDMVVIDSGWHEQDYLKQMGFTWDWLRQQNIALCYIARTPNISTTDIRGRL